MQIGFWSLISGPPDVRLFELHDATVLLERGSDGAGNWVMGAPAEVETATEVDDDDEEAVELEVPVIIRSAQLNNVRLIYREAKKHDRVRSARQAEHYARPGGAAGARGRRQARCLSAVVEGCRSGPLKSLLSARDMRIDMQGSLGKLALDIKGAVGSLDPLDGADLTLKVEHPDLERMLGKLELPVIATGPMQIDGRLKDAGALTQLDFDAKGADFSASVKGTIKTLSLVGGDLTLKLEHSEIGAVLKALELPVIATGLMQIDTHIKDVGKRRQLDLKAKLGDLEASVKGTLKTRSLIGSDLKFEANAADAARLASVFEVSGVPAAPLKVSGHTVYSRKQVKFDALTAAIADASVRVDGSMQFTGDRKLALNFEVAAASLAKLKETWPDIKVSASGAFEHTKDRIELKGSAGGPGRESVGRFAVVDRWRQTNRSAAFIAASGPHAIFPA